MGIDSDKVIAWIAVIVITSPFWWSLLKLAISLGMFETANDFRMP
jgi:hypothetical protein